MRIVILFEPSVDPSVTERGVYRLGLCQRRLERPFRCKLDPDPGRVAWLRAELRLERCQVRELEDWQTRMLLRHAEASAPARNESTPQLGPFFDIFCFAIGRNVASRPPPRPFHSTR